MWFCRRTESISWTKYVRTAVPNGPRGLRRRSAATRLLRSWVRIPPPEWMSVCCECCVLPGIGLCDGLITRPEESYRLWCVVVCDLETSSRMRMPWPALGCRAIGGKKNCVRNEQVLHRFKEERNILLTVQQRKANWIGYILCRNCFVKQVLEGNTQRRIEVMGRRERRCKRLLDDPK